MNSYLGGEYQVVCYMRIEMEDEEGMPLAEAEKQKEQLELRLPELICKIERLDETE